MRRAGTCGLTIALGLLAFAAAPAQAAQRFVTTGGSGIACTQASPCSLGQGINSAASGDEVIVGSGTYSTALALAIPVGASGVTIHGAAGQPRPVLNLAAADGLTTTTSGTTIRDLTINHSGTGTGLYVFSFGSVVDRVDVHSTSQACRIGGTIRDSLCVSASSNIGAAGIVFNVTGGTWDLKLRNVTAIGGPAAPGISFNSGGATSVSVDARNVIAQGHGAAKDVLAGTDLVTSSTSIVLQNSNYDTAAVTGPGSVSVTPPGSGTNQTAPPVFAETAEYHQAAGSPTIDAGGTDADLGTADLDGDARTLGSAPDIGVDEFVPAVTPPDTTPPETTIDKGPKKKTKSKKATFTFSSSEAGSTFVCAVDKKAAAPCTSPLKLKKLKNGKHTLTVTATDTAGNADATSASYKWKVVKKKPKKR